MKNMTDKKELVKDFIQNRPNLSGNKIYEQIKGKEFSIRKTDFYTLLREIRNLPEPTIQKREKSVPIKYKIKPIKPKKPKKVIKPIEIPFEQTKFGQITKNIQKTHGISERNAIIRVRALLKIPKRDYQKLNRKDRDILTQYGY